MRTIIINSIIYVLWWGLILVIYGFISWLKDRKRRKRKKLVNKETTFDDYLKEQLKDPEFRKEWEKLKTSEEDNDG